MSRVDSAWLGPLEWPGELLEGCQIHTNWSLCEGSGVQGTMKQLPLELLFSLGNEASAGCLLESREGWC